MIPSGIKDERSNVMKTLCVDHVLVVVLDSKVFPDNNARFALHGQRYGATSEIAALRADVERSSAAAGIRRTLS